MVGSADAKTPWDYAAARVQSCGQLIGFIATHRRYVWVIATDRVGNLSTQPTTATTTPAHSPLGRGPFPARRKSIPCLVRKTPCFPIREIMPQVTECGQISASDICTRADFENFPVNFPVSREMAACWRDNFFHRWMRQRDAWDGEDLCRQWSLRNRKKRRPCRRVVVWTTNRQSFDKTTKARILRRAFSLWGPMAADIW